MPKTSWLIAALLLPAWVAAAHPPAGFVALKLRREIAVELARVCANEDSRPLRPVSGGGTAGEPTEDCLGILQTALGLQRRSGHDVLSALRTLAPHVTGARVAVRARHAIYGALPASGNARPPGWEDDSHGSWQIHGPHWTTFRENIVDLVQSGFKPPCPGEPLHWGNVEDLEIARSRGLCILPCGERNYFVARPGEGCTEKLRTGTIPASIAAGR